MVRSLIAKSAVVMTVVCAAGLPASAGAQTGAREAEAVTAPSAEGKAGQPSAKRSLPARDGAASARAEPPPKTFGDQLKRDFRGAGTQIKRDWNSLRDLF